VEVQQDRSANRRDQAGRKAAAARRVACKTRLENPRLVVDPPPCRRNPFLRGPAHLQIAFDGVRRR